MSAIDEGGMFHGEANRIHGTKMRQGHLHPDHRSRPSRTTTKPYCSSKTINYIRHGSPIVLQGSPTSAIGAGDDDTQSMDLDGRP
jgi:hypothetical protein